MLSLSMALLALAVFIPRYQAFQIRPNVQRHSADATHASGRRCGSNLLPVPSSSFQLFEQNDKTPMSESTDDIESKPIIAKADDNVPLERRQEDNDKAVMDRLLLPSRLGNAFTSALWFFVGAGILLNMSGYAYIFDGDWANFRIGTMDERRFREEIVRDMKRTPSSNEVTTEGFSDSQ